MKKSGMVLCALFLAAQNVYAANAPIQRIDVVNMLGSASSATSVTVSFSNGFATPCITKTLSNPGAMTVLAGTGQACATAVTSITITPIEGVGGAIYELTPVTENINSTYYLTQISIKQANSPVFDPTNGGLLIPGTVQAVAVSNLANK